MSASSLSRSQKSTPKVRSMTVSTHTLEPCLFKTCSEAGHVYSFRFSLYPEGSVVVETNLGAVEVNKEVEVFVNLAVFSIYAAR